MWATIPTTEFYIPEWQKDAEYVGFDEVNNLSKFVTALKGPGILAIKQTKEVDEVYNKIRNKVHETYVKIYKNIKKEISIKERIAITKKVINKYKPKYDKALNKFKITQTTNNQGILFYTKNTIFSEPKKDVPQFFISIMPETKENIEGLKKAWNR